MIINIEGKKVEISDKNARAYDALNGIPVDNVTILCYYNAKYHLEKNKLLNIIKDQSEKEISEFIDKCLMEEAIDCGGKEFYERI